MRFLQLILATSVAMMPVLARADYSNLGHTIVETMTFGPNGSGGLVSTFSMVLGDPDGYLPFIDSISAIGFTLEMGIYDPPPSGYGFLLTLTDVSDPWEYVVYLEGTDGFPAKLNTSNAAGIFIISWDGTCQEYRSYCPPGGAYWSDFNIVPAVPEPSSLILLFTTLLGVTLVTRKRIARMNG